MPDERKQINRDVEPDRDTRSKPTTDNIGNTKPKRPLNWDARDIKADTWL